MIPAIFIRELELFQTFQVLWFNRLLMFEDWVYIIELMLAENLTLVINEGFDVIFSTVIKLACRLCLNPLLLKLDSITNIHLILQSLWVNLCWSRMTSYLVDSLALYFFVCRLPSKVKECFSEVQDCFKNNSCFFTKLSHRLL